MSKAKREELFTISVVKDEVGNICFIERRDPEGYNLFEAAFLASLFQSLYAEYHKNLVAYQGEEKTYLIEEFYRLEVADIRADMEKSIAHKLEKRVNEAVNKALEVIKDANTDLEGFAE